MKTLFNFIPRLALAFSGGNPVRFAWLLIRLYWFAVTRKFFGNRFTHPFEVSGYFNGRPIVFNLERAMEIAVLVEMFSDREYEWDLEKDPEVIVDLGAYIGDTALYYHAMYPTAKIFAVEPSPESFARLKKHVEHIENIVPINAAVGTTDSEVSFYLGESNLGYSLLKRDDSKCEVSVKQYTMDTLCQMYSIPSIDLLKFDIEGIEFDLFEKTNFSKLATHYIGELHFQLSEKYNLEDLETLTQKPVDNCRHLFGGRYLVRF